MVQVHSCGRHDFFDQLDLDHDGEITCYEFESFFSNLKIKCGEATLDILLAYLMTNATCVLEEIPVVVSAYLVDLCTAASVVWLYCRCLLPHCLVLTVADSSYCSCDTNCITYPKVECVVWLQMSPIVQLFLQSEVNDANAKQQPIASVAEFEQRVKALFDNTVSTGCTATHDDGSLSLSVVNALYGELHYTMHT